MKTIKIVFSVIFTFGAIIAKSAVFLEVFNGIISPIFKLSTIDTRQAFLLTIAQFAVFTYSLGGKNKEEEKEEFVWMALRPLVHHLYTLVLVIVIVWASKVL